MTTIISGRTINEAVASEINADETHRRVKKHPVVEIFGPTIQGEGAMLGEQTMFIRFGGCDYRCTKCDSLHAVLPEEVKKNSAMMTPDDILAGLEQFPIKAQWVTLSGGNPVMHNLTQLVTDMNGVGYRIAVETQGSLWADWLLDCDHITISPKGPGMGEKFDPDDFDHYIQMLTNFKNKSLYSYDWSVKVVIMSAQDLEFAKGLLEKWPVIQKRFYLSLGNPFPPVVGEKHREGLHRGDDIRLPLLDHYVTLVEDILQEPSLAGCIVTPQFHVLLWGNKQGV